MRSLVRRGTGILLGCNCFAVAIRGEEIVELDKILYDLWLFDLRNWKKKARKESITSWEDPSALLAKRVDVVGLC